MSVADLAYIDTTGYHFADYPAFLAYIQDSYRAIYGADVYLEADSQDGQFLAIIAKALYDTAALGASTYNSFSPISAQGTGLSRNVKINGITRREATHSTVDVVIVGSAGTTITNGVAIDTLNQKWNVPSPTVIPGGGTITVTAVAQELGALNALANTVNKIFTPTRGWQTVNNPGAATPGVAVEVDAALRIRQAQSVADPSLTVLDGTVGGVANLPGVTAVKGYENFTGSTDANGLVPHSIEIVVKGGDNTDIAQEILLHKTPGTNVNGSTSVLVYDSHGMPSTIKFQRPTVVTITSTITIATNPAWSSDYEDQIRDLVAATINEFGIGASILITKLFAPAYLNGAVGGDSYDIVTLEIGRDMDPQSTVNIDLDFDEIPLCVAATDITLVIT